MLTALMTSNAVSMQYGNNFPPIETKRASDEMIHIGRDIWISEIQYNRVYNSSKTPRQFASNILFPVFDDTLLLTSTVTGYTSTRNGEKRKCHKLDEKKIGACEDIYKHWIKTIYKQKFAEIPEKDNSTQEMSKFYHYVGKKLADLKKTSREKDENYNLKKRTKSGKENEKKTRKNITSIEKRREEQPSTSNNNKSRADEREIADSQQGSYNAHEDENNFYDYSPHHSSEESS